MPDATALAPPPAVKPVPAAARHLPGEEGIWVFILGDMTVFAVLFAVYLDARRHAVSGFARDAAQLSTSLGAVNTLLLLGSSLLVVIALDAVRRGDARAARWVSGAMACGVGFVAVKALEWGGHLANGENPGTDRFWRYYFILTGLHLFHLLVGLGALAYLRRATRTDGTRQISVAEGCACYWHMVDLLWVVLFALFYVAR